MEARGPARRAHPVPTPLAVLLIIGWLGAMLWGAATLLTVAALSVGSFFGDPAPTEGWTEAIGFSIGAVSVAAAGPLGIWLFHRRRGWLVTAGLIATATAALAAYLLVTFSSN